MLTKLSRVFSTLPFLMILSLPATAQPVQNDPSILALREARIAPLNIFQRAPFVPVHVYGIEAPETVRAGEPVVFSAHANVRVVTLPAEASWTFDDGTVMHGLSVERTFDEPGVQRVRFEMSNAGSRQERVIRVVVHPADETMKSTPGDQS